MTFTPGRTTISNITQAYTAVVTTASNHGLFTGNVVRLIVPPAYGMFQLNNRVISVTVLSPTSFSCQISQAPAVINLSTIDYPAFVVPGEPGFVASVIPIGSGATQITDVEWQRTNNFCASKVDDALINNSTVPIPF